jgi:hypothetical protein
VTFAHARCACSIGARGRSVTFRSLPRAARLAQSPHGLSDSRSGPSDGKDDREGATTDTVVASGVIRLPHPRAAAATAGEPSGLSDLPGLNHAVTVSVTTPVSL